jgi:hypothetical protein
LTPTTQDLLDRIKTLERELEDKLDEKERAFRYRWLRGKARFEDEILSQHRKLKVGLAAYVLDSRILAVLTAPLIYLCFIPFALLDLFLSIYQIVCFSVYGIPKVKRSDYIVFDRGRLVYLNLLERLNCAYCSYANGLCGYVTEIAARTEQHWCPIKHAQRLRAPHSRYQRFFDYGDAQRYHRELERIRSDFVDITTIVPKP